MVRILIYRILRLSWQHYLQQIWAYYFWMDTAIVDTMSADMEICSLVIVSTSTFATLV